MPQDQTLLVVDTNCFIRLLDGPRPLLGRVLGEHKLVTTSALLGEATKSKSLLEKYPALKDARICRELEAATLKFSTKDQALLRELTEDLREGGQALLTQHCADQKIALRRLSLTDAAAWAVAMHVGGALATDEWPLRHVAELLSDDAGNTVPLFSSIGLLHLLRQADQLTPDECWNMMRQWRIEDERLHREADQEYKQLFGVTAPNAQSKRK